MYIEDTENDEEIGEPEAKVEGVIILNPITPMIITLGNENNHS